LHLDRLWAAAATVGMDLKMTRAELLDKVQMTLDANEMQDNVHVRFMVTRGIKKTPSQDPRLTISGPNLVIIAEHKVASEESKEKGITLFTSSIKRGSPDYLDPKLNCHSKLHEVMALTGAYCMNGITRHNIIRVCKENNIPVFEKNFSLFDTYSADEAFVTGTFGGLTPVTAIDGRKIGNGTYGAMSKKLSAHYKALIASEIQKS